MFPYWLLFLFFAIGAIANQKVTSDKGRFLLLVAFVVMTLMIGFRYHVGGDWFTYIAMLKRTETRSFGEALALGDPAFMAINWVASQAGLGVWFPNLVCGTIFSWGLYKLVRTLPAPWLSTAVAVPYLVIVIAMGFTRQSAALGLLMAGLADFSRRESPLRFFGYTLVATMFHSSAAVVFPLVAFASKRNFFVTVLMTVSIAYVIYSSFLAPTATHFINRYITAKASSQGALIRVGMDFVAGVIFLIANRHYAMSPIQVRLWRNFALVSIVMLLALAITPSSTAIDRVSFYLIPIQLVVFGQSSGDPARKFWVTTSTLLLYGAVEFVWLFFSVYASYWIPYRIYPF